MNCLSSALLRNWTSVSSVLKSRVIKSSFCSPFGASLVNSAFKRMSSTTSRFEDAKNKLNSLQEDPGNDMKLKIYALFKQATLGPCNTPKPGMLDLIAKAKWQAWKSLGEMSQDEAKEQYVSLVDEIAVSSPSCNPSTTSGDQTYDGLICKIDNNVTKITLCRPQKKNAITFQMYKDISSALKEAAENDTSVAVITGEGDYYSSGNDLSNFTSLQGEVSTLAKQAADVLQSFVSAFIDFPKPLIAAVNGPAVGIPVTLLPLFDVVYASDKATFYTPFSLLGQSPEACSTYTFPKIMGYGKANQMLLFNKKLSAAEAKEASLVADVFPHDSFRDEVEKCLRSICEASKQSMVFSKQLIRDIERDTLHKVNAAECERLVERWQSPDCMQALMNFFQRKSKL